MNRYERAWAHVDALEATLPWNLRTAEDARALEVYAQAVDRRQRFYVEDVMKQVFADLETIYPDEEVLRHKQGQGLLDELGLRLKQLHDFVEAEVIPPLRDLERGIAYMDRQEISAEGCLKVQDFLPRYIAKRKLVRDTLPVAWRLAIPVRSLFLRLPPELQEEAQRRWGPMRAGSSPQDVWILLKEIWPGKILEDLDEEARRHGYWPADRPRPQSRRRTKS